MSSTAVLTFIAALMAISFAFGVLLGLRLSDQRIRGATLFGIVILFSGVIIALIGLSA